MAVVRSPKDLVAGLMFIGIGIASIVIASNYTLGTAARMGPGYFPRILGILMILLGAIIALRSLRVTGPPLPGWKWRPVLVVLGSVLIFGLVVDRLGLVLSTIMLIMMSSAASVEFRPKEAAISGVLLAVLAVGVFVIGLKLQIGIWPGAR
jgi:putative tricarboxylic transport membrane protein